MKLSLVVVSPGQMNQWTIHVRQPSLVIGRQADCHLQPTSILVSKRHCMVSTSEDAAFVDDLGSTNGTFLNDQPVREKTELQDDDLLQVGPLLFRVQLEAGSPDLQEQQSSAEMAEEELAATLLMGIPDRPKRRFPAALQGAIAPLAAETGVDPGTTQSGVREPELKEKDAAPQRAKPAEADMGGTALAAKAILRKHRHTRQ